MKTFYPVFLKLSGKPVLVVGGGKVAEQKIVGLLKAGARVKVMAKSATRQVGDWARGRKIVWIKRNCPPLPTLHPSGRGRFFLVISATDDEKVNAAISRACAKSGILCNVVDNSGLSSFIAPSVGRKGGITLAVSTAGASPLMAGLVRRSLEKRIGLAEIRLLRFLKSLRPKVKATLKSPAVRRRFYRKLVLGPVGALAATGRPQEARNRALKLIAASRQRS